MTPSLNQASKHCASELGIRKEFIPKYIIEILDQLQQHGFSALLVGGCIRDLLLNSKPKDFDIATNATPPQIRRIFKRSEIIGKRFIIVHVIVGRMRIEVTTFRGDGESQENIDGKSFQKNKSTGILGKDNHYGTQSGDAARRDFTCNALYYDIHHDIVYDYYNGIDAIQSKKLILIGEPSERFHQDPVRMLRLIRFMAKLGFTAEDDLLNATRANANLLSHVAPGRLFDEVNKLLLNGFAKQTFDLLNQYELLPYLFSTPALDYYHQSPDLINHALMMTDVRVNENKPVISAYLYALLLWPVLLQKLNQLMENQSHVSANEMQHIASEFALMTQLPKTSMMRRVTTSIRDIWQKQFQLNSLHPAHSLKLLEHPKFRAGYDMYVMRSEFADGNMKLANFWTKVQTLESLPEKQKYLENFIANNPELAKAKVARNKRRKRTKKRR